MHSSGIAPFFFGVIAAFRPHGGKVLFYKNIDLPKYCAAMKIALQTGNLGPVGRCNPQSCPQNLWTFIFSFLGNALGLEGEGKSSYPKQSIDPVSASQIRCIS